MCPDNALGTLWASVVLKRLGWKFPKSTMFSMCACLSLFYTLAMTGSYIPILLLNINSSSPNISAFAIGNDAVPYSDFSGPAAIANYSIGLAVPATLLLVGMYIVEIRGRARVGARGVGL